MAGIGSLDAPHKVRIPHKPPLPCNLIGLAERSTLKAEIELFVDDGNYLAC